MPFFRAWGALSKFSGPEHPGLLPKADVSCSDKQGLGFRVKGLGFRVKGLGFRVRGLGLRVLGEQIVALGLKRRTLGSMSAWSFGW